jgi:predicted GNAT family acetyltransferase
VSNDEITVRNVPERQRYEVLVGGQLAGQAVYQLRGDDIEFMHTVIDPRFEHRGVGTRLVRAALDDVRARGASALPYCPFVRSFIAAHDEYLDLVPERRRAAFDL